MKRIILLAATFSILSAGGAQAQSFLNKMKQKAESAVSQTMGKITGNDSAPQAKVDITDQPSGDNTNVVTTLVTDSEYENKEKNSYSYSVDLYNVSPASGNTYEQLLGQLPALPTAAQLASPNEQEYQSYFRKLAAVRLKCEEIEQDICESQVAQYQQHQRPRQTNANPMESLTQQEIETLMKEGEQIEKEVAAQEKKLGHKMSDMEQLNFIRKNHKEFFSIALKMNEAQSGVSAADMEKLLNDIDAESKAKGRSLTVDEMDQIAKAKYPDLYSKNMAAKKKADKARQDADEEMAFVQGEIDKPKKIEAYQRKTARNKEDDIRKCNQFAAKYESQLRDIYREIIGSSSQAQIAQLYAKADAMIADYRRSAADSWLGGISSHIDLIKSTLPERVAIENSKDECVINRTKVGQLSRIIDDMEDAYGEFPLISVEPAQVSRTNITCYRAESVFYPKVTGFMQNSRLSKDGEDLSKKFSCDKVKPAYGTYKSADGKRQVIFKSDGSLTLPGGYVHYPIALEQQGDILVWYDVIDQTIFEYKYKL